VQVTDIGYDDNVFRVDKRANPVGDFTFTASPSARLLLGMPRLRVESQGRLDFIYFKEIASVRSIDANAYARVEVPLARVTPYAGVDWISARHRRNFEIDLPVRRVDLSTNAGVDVALSPKTSAGVMTRWSRVDYAGDTIYLDTDLAQFLGATARSNGARVRYAATPLTTVGAEVERDTSEFAAVPARNSTGFRVTSVVEFRPLALVSGRAQVGFRRRSFVDGAARPFRGTVARVDLGYTLLGQTRFAFLAQRDLSYSYRADKRDYLQTGMQVGVSHRFADAWDLGGSLGRFNLLYGLAAVTGPGARAERVWVYTAELGYRFDRSRVGFRFSRQTRSSDFSSFRDYEEMRIGAMVSYGF